MCDPVSATLAVLSTAFTYQSQAAAAKQQEQALKDMYEMQTEALMDRYKQINQNATDEMSERAQEARVEQARLKTIAGESGLGGTSQDLIMRESEFKAGSDLAQIEGNRQNAIKQAKREGDMNRLEVKSQSAAIRRPSLIGAGLQIATAGVDIKTRADAAKAKAK